ncbi:MAG: LLM class flavin-dependent oxidoreductase [Anaerolineae bacterium]|nr:LLM class flavin-dependent oxidoreductase [Anaerolineae bacterium]
MHVSQPRQSLGVIFHPLFPPETLADYAHRAEAAGFDELWLWDDCFLPGALTSAAIALSATQRLKVGIGLMPATAYNSLFAAMEITTLARAFPGRILPGFGHGIGSWMQQIGAAPKSSLKSLGETVDAVQRLLAGECVTAQGTQVQLEAVQMQLTPTVIPPVLVGAMQEKTLRLAGRSAEGAILPALSSPAYVRWALEHIREGMAETGRNNTQLVVYLDAKVGVDAEAARRPIRRWIAERLPWSAVQLKPLGLAEEAAALVERYGTKEAAQHIPDAWVDALSASGTPRQAVDAIRRLWDAGATSVVLQPLDGDPDCLEAYARELLPLLRA